MRVSVGHHMGGVGSSSHGTHRGRGNRGGHHMRGCG